MSTSRDQPNRSKRRPKKSSRAPEDEDASTPKSVPKGQQEKAKTKYIDTTDPKQRLRDRIKQMQKDRAKGSYVCEENANHEY